MSSLTGTYTAYTCHGVTKSLTTLSTTQVPHRPPGKGEITLRVCATGLNPMDFKLSGVTGVIGLIMDLAGLSAAKAKGQGIVPGADVSGVVAAIGEGAEKWKVGDEVFGCNLSLVRSSLQEYTD
jgi:NADPH:quinone reductase-like Zn-dependent oxidoreductase